MASNIEIVSKGWENKGHYYRTTCACMSDEHDITFYVNADKEAPHQVFLEVFIDVSTLTDSWYYPRWNRWFFGLIKRVKYATRILFTGYIQTSTSFIFRDDEHINAFIETIQEARDMVKENSGE